MKKTINTEIKDKIITKKDLFMFSKVFWDKYSKSKSDHKKLTFNFDCDEWTSNYEIENAKLETEEDFLDTKKINAISMYFIDYNSNKKIRLSLSHGNSSRTNKLTIESEDSSWVDKVLNIFNEKMEALKPQNNRFLKYYKFFFHFCSLSIGLLGINLLSFILNFLPIPKSPTKESNRIYELLANNILAQKIFILIVAWILGVSRLRLSFDKIKKLWPNVEFDFWPEHLKKEKKTRKTLWIIWSLIIIPLIIQILFFLFTK